MEVSPENIISVVDSFRAMLGVDFCAEHLEALPPAKIGIWSTTENSTEHPAARTWREIRDYAQKWSNNEDPSISDEALWLCNGLADMYDIKNFPGFSRIVKLFRNKKSYHSALFEASIIQAYKALGYKIEIPIEIDGQRNCDLKVNLDDNEIFVECKSLQDEDKVNDRMASALCENILKLLKKHNKLLMVSLSVLDTVTYKEIRLFTDEFKERLKQDNLKGEWQAKNVPIFVSVRRSCIRDFIYFDLEKYGLSGKMPNLRPIEEQPLPSQILFESQTDRSRDIFRNIMYVKARPFRRMQYSTTILNIIKKDFSQIPKGERGIFHIEIPYRDGVRYEEIVDELYHDVAVKFPAHTSRVNAIAIHGSRIHPEFDTKRVIALHDTYMIPNPMARAPLPEGFQIVGANSSPWPKRSDNKQFISNEGMKEVDGKIHINIDGPEGAIYIGVEIGDYKKTPGARIIEYCSPHADKQFRIYATHKGMFRFELITSPGDRKFVEAGINLFPTGEQFILCMRWSNSFMDVRIISMNPDVPDRLVAEKSF